MTGEVKQPVRAGREQQRQQQPLNSSPTSSSSLSSASLSTSTSTDKRRRRRNMSKLSPGLKALINAPFARPGPCRVAKGAASAAMGEVFRGIAQEASGKGVGARAWLAISVSIYFCLFGFSSVILFFFKLHVVRREFVSCFAFSQCKGWKAPPSTNLLAISGKGGCKTKKIKRND